MMGRRQHPGKGVAERSVSTRKLSVAFPVQHMDSVHRIAVGRGVSAAVIVREAVARYITDPPASDAEGQG